MQGSPLAATLCLLQVVDLEGAAEHKGSVLGDHPDKPQPPQKMFESLLLAQMRHFSVQRPVWIESESAMVGLRDVPRCLWKVRVEMLAWLCALVPVKGDAHACSATWLHTRASRCRG